MEELENPVFFFKWKLGNDLSLFFGAFTFGVESREVIPFMSTDTYEINTHSVQGALCCLLFHKYTPCHSVPLTLVVRGHSPEHQRHCSLIIVRVYRSVLLSSLRIV